MKKLVRTGRKASIPWGDGSLVEVPVFSGPLEIGQDYHERALMPDGTVAAAQAIEVGTVLCDSWLVYDGESCEPLQQIAAETLDEATDVLEAAAVDAAKAEKEGTRKPILQSTGVYLYAGPRLELELAVVKNDENFRTVEGGRLVTRPQLVYVRVLGAGET